MGSRADAATPAGSGEAADPATPAGQASGAGAGETAAAGPALPGEAAPVDSGAAEALPDGGQPADAGTDDASTDEDADTGEVRYPAGPDRAGSAGGIDGTGEPGVNGAAGRTAHSASGGTRTQRPEGAVGTLSPGRPGVPRGAARLGLRPATRRASWQRAPGVLFAAVTILPSLLLMAWLLPGLPLLLAGRFADIPMIVISVPLAIALIVMLFRELPSAWPHGIRDLWSEGRAAPSEAAQPGAAQPATAAPGTEHALSSPGVQDGNGAVGPDAPGAESGEPGADPGQSGVDPGEPGVDAGEPEPGMDLRTDPVEDAPLAPAGPGPQPADTAAPSSRLRRGRPRDSQNTDVPWWALAGTIAVALGFAVWQFAENSQQIIVLRDPGTYLQFAYWIAGHGSTRIPQSLQAFGGAHQGLTFSSLGFYSSGTSVVPQFMAGLPMTLAIGVWAGGQLGAVAMAPIIGACAVLAFAGLAGRLVGARWAPAAALVLAVSLPEQYTGRTTFSETLAQVMLYGGLCMLADSFVLTGGRHVVPLPEPSSWRDGPAPNITLAFFGGLSIGLTLLIRIDGLSDLLPAIPFLGILLITKRPQAIPFGIGLFIGAAYGFADGYLLSRPYLNSIAASLRPLAMIALAAVALTGVGMGLLSARRTRSWLRFLFRSRPLRWLPEAVAALTVLAVAGFAARPYFQTVRGETNPATISYVAELQQLAHLAIDPRRQYSEDSLYWVIWYIGVPAVILGTIGIALLARRCLRALLTWRDSGYARIWALPLMIIGWVTVTVLWRPGIIPDQPWASRRLVPVVLPGLILAAVWASAWIKERGRQLGASRLAACVVAVCCVIALLVPAAVTTFGVGTTKSGSGSARLTANGLAFKRTGPARTRPSGNCAPVSGRTRRWSSSTRSPPTGSARSSGECARPRRPAWTTRSRLRWPRSWRASSGPRRPILLAEQQSQLTPYGGGTQQVLNLLTTQDAHQLTQPPARTWLIHFVVWMSQPASVTGGAVAGQAAEYSRRA